MLPSTITIQYSGAISDMILISALYNSDYPRYSRVTLFTDLRSTVQ